MKLARSGTCLALLVLYVAVEISGLPLKHRTNRKPWKAPQDFEKYRDAVSQIGDYVLRGAGKGGTYRKLQWLVDTYGPRVAGTGALENAIDGIIRHMTIEQLDNVHTEPAVVLNWRPLNWGLSVLSGPRSINMSILPLSPSVNTPAGGITATILVVRNFTELAKRASEAKGKIVVFNPDWVSYGDTVQYRVLGAQQAAQYGAVGALVRSITPFSIYSPHTGFQLYDGTGKIPKIPVASITVEDAQFLERVAGGRSDTVRVRFVLEAQDLGNFTSRHTIGELTGLSKPNETVLVSGHLDSWFVGVGAMDDGGGAMISWEALALLKQLGMRAKRTIRTVLWTGEEQAGVGSHQYYEAHKADVPKMDFVMESDMGTFTPLGLAFTGNAAAQQVIRQVLNLLAPFNATQYAEPDESTDIADWEAAGVPGASLLNDDGKYFYFHHSMGDQLTVENSDELDLCVAVWASVAYIVADLDDMLPRDSSPLARPSILEPLL